MKKSITIAVAFAAILVVAALILNRMDFLRFGYQGKAIHFTTETERNLKKIGDGVKGIFGR